MPRTNVKPEPKLDEFYANPEFVKSADSFLGRITEHQTECGGDYSKQAIFDIAVQILKERIAK